MRRRRGAAVEAARRNGGRLRLPGWCSVCCWWFAGFLVVGGEWFQMWQSKTWNGQEAAFRFVACIGLVLIFLNQPDGELT